MTPIVNGLELEYQDEIDFYYLNVEDGSIGEQAFKDFALRGHPNILLLDEVHNIRWQGVGILSAEEIRQELDRILSEE